LHVAHLLSISAAGLAFWKRREHFYTWKTPDFFNAGLWAALFAWVLFSQFLAGASQTTYPYFVTLLDAALLFYAARRAACQNARLTLVGLTVGHLLLLLGTVLHLHFLETLSSTLLTAVFILFAALALLFSILPIADRDTGAIRLNLPRPPVSQRTAIWKFAFVCLIGFCVVLAVSRITVHNRRIDLQAQVIDFPRQALAPELAREAFQRSPIEGIGLGIFEPLMRGNGIFFVPVSRTPAPPNLFPKKEAEYLRKIQNSDQATDTTPHTLPSWYAEPRSLHSYQIITVEIGLLGTAFALAAILFLASSTIRTVFTTEYNAHSIFTLAVLAAWLALLLEGFFGIALHKYQGILLFATLSGYLWGIGSVLRGQQPEAETKTLPTPAMPLTWKRIAPVASAAFLLLLVMAIPAYNARMLNAIRRDKTDSTAYTYATAILKQNPFLEETYAVLARFHQERREPEKMGIILDKAASLCPASPLLLAWRVELSRMIDQPLARIPQLSEAARSVSALRPELQPFYLRECAEELEKLSRYDDSLELRRRLFLLNPADKDARANYERAAKLADISSSTYR
jgi:hypothetical protein